MDLTVNIVLGNLKPQLLASNSDTVSFVKGALEINGVNVKVGLDQIDPNAINLFFHACYQRNNRLALIIAFD